MTTNQTPGSTHTPAPSWATTVTRAGEPGADANDPHYARFEHFTRSREQGADCEVLVAVVVGSDLDGTVVTSPPELIVNLAGQEMYLHMPILARQVAQAILKAADVLEAAQDQHAGDVTPSLPCPSWCVPPENHGWDSMGDDGTSAATFRVHQRLLLEEDFAEVSLTRHDRLRLSDSDESVVEASCVQVEVHSGEDGAGIGLTEEQSAAVVDAMQEGQRLLRAAREDGTDPWEEQQRTI